MELWIALTLGSALTFAIGDVISKKYLNKLDISPKQLIFEQNLIIGILLFIFFLPFIEFNFFYQYYYLFLGKALFLGSATIIYASMLKKYEISLVSPLLNLSPIILLIFSSLILSESITFFQGIGILITIIATYILEVTHHHHKKKEPHEFHFKELFKKPSLFFILAFTLMLVLSLTAVFDKLIFNTGVNVYTNMYFTASLIFLFISAYFIKEKTFFKSIKRTIKEPQTLIIGVIKMLDQFLILSAFSIPNALVSLMVPLRRCSTLFSSILGGLIFHEKHMLRKLIAVILMLVGISFIVL